jgi:hypothetical protein
MLCPRAPPPPQQHTRRQGAATIAQAGTRTDSILARSCVFSCISETGPGQAPAAPGVSENRLIGAPCLHRHQRDSSFLDRARVLTEFVQSVRLSAGTSCHDDKFSEGVGGFGCFCSRCFRAGCACGCRGWLTALRRLLHKGKRTRRSSRRDEDGSLADNRGRSPASAGRDTVVANAQRSLLYRLRPPGRILPVAGNCLDVVRSVTVQSARARSRHHSLPCRERLRRGNLDPVIWTAKPDAGFIERRIDRTGQIDLPPWTPSGTSREDSTMQEFKAARLPTFAGDIRRASEIFRGGV